MVYKKQIEMPKIHKRILFILALVLTLPLQAQVRSVYIDSARVARILAEEAGKVASVAGEADTDSLVELAEPPAVARNTRCCAPRRWRSWCGT